MVLFLNKCSPMEDVYSGHLQMSSQTTKVRWPSRIRKQVLFVADVQCMWLILSDPFKLPSNSSLNKHARFWGGVEEPPPSDFDSHRWKNDLKGERPLGTLDTKWQAVSSAEPTESNIDALRCVLTDGQGYELKGGWHSHSFHSASFPIWSNTHLLLPMRV